jgi:DNA-binding transcriptional ArsR family regulator
MHPPQLPPKQRIALLKALASPARIEVVEVMQISGPATVAEISAQLGRAPDSLYHHLRQLEQAGIVERHGMQKSGGRSGAVYALCARQVGVDSTEESPADEREAMADLGGAILRLTVRDTRSALTVDWESSPDFDGLNEFPFVQRTKAWLRPEEAEVVMGKINELLDYMRERSVREDNDKLGARLFALTQVLSPVGTRKSQRDARAVDSEVAASPELEPRPSS